MPLCQKKKHVNNTNIFLYVKTNYSTHNETNRIDALIFFCEFIGISNF